MLLDVRPLLQKRQEVPPHQVAADRYQSQDIFVLAVLVDEVKG